MHSEYQIEWEDQTVGTRMGVPGTTVHADTYGALEHAILAEAGKHVEPDPDTDLEVQMVRMPDGRFSGFVTNGFKIAARFDGWPVEEVEAG